MAVPIKLLLHLNDGQLELEVRILHPMDPGDVLSRAAGSRRPPVFMQSMVIQMNGKTLVEGQLSASISRNPVFRFMFADTKRGDRFTVYCTDNKGKEFKNEIVVANL